MSMSLADNGMDGTEFTGVMGDVQSMQHPDPSLVERRSLVQAKLAGAQRRYEAALEETEVAAGIVQRLRNELNGFGRLPVVG